MLLTHCRPWVQRQGEPPPPCRSRTQPTAPLETRRFGLNTLQVERLLAESCFDRCAPAVLVAVRARRLRARSTRLAQALARRVGSEPPPATTTNAVFRRRTMQQRQCFRRRPAKLHPATGWHAANLEEVRTCARTADLRSTTLHQAA